MKVGTKSMLFGVHAFWWHPVTVLLAWIYLYRRLPGWAETVAIVFHDQYWGCVDIDGEHGKRHPYCGAKIARLFGGETAARLALLHSRSLARILGKRPSKLCAPDKLSIFFDPPAFYLLRARLSGEIVEFHHNAIVAGQIPAGASQHDWLGFYRNSVRREFGFFK